MTLPYDSVCILLCLSFKIVYYQMGVRGNGDYTQDYGPRSVKTVCVAYCNQSEFEKSVNPSIGLLLSLFLWSGNYTIESVLLYLTSATKVPAMNSSKLITSTLSACADCYQLPQFLVLSVDYRRPPSVLQRTRGRYFIALSQGDDVAPPQVQYSHCVNDRIIWSKQMKKDRKQKCSQHI